MKENKKLKVKRQNYRLKFKMKIRKTRIVEPNRRLAVGSVETMVAGLFMGFGLTYIHHVLKSQ